MDIEILTTKKKLSKSLVKQLNIATLGDLRHVHSTTKVGYYIRDLGKGSPANVMLFEGIYQWVRVGVRSWEKSNTRDTEIYAPASELGDRGTSVKSFSCKGSRDSWIEAYDAAKKICLKNHLFI